MKLKNLLNKKIELNSEVNTETVKAYIFKIFAILIFLLPAVPEIIGYGIYSLKCTLFNLITFISTILILLISIYERARK